MRPVGSAGATPAPEAQRLMRVARQLEGVFVQEMFKAMRATVPDGQGMVDGGAGEEMFTGMMDQHLADEVPAGWERGLAQALYRSLGGTPPQPTAQTSAGGRPPHEGGS